MANNNNSISPNMVLAVGGLGLLFVAGKKIFEALGLSKSGDDKAREEEFKKDQAQLSQQDYFDPDFYKKPGAKLITVAVANGLAKKIYDAKNIINDDEAAVYGVFQALQTKSQVSFLAEIFFNIYGKSLLGFLLSFLNDTEMQTVAKITNKLPLYTV